MVKSYIKWEKQGTSTCINVRCDKHRSANTGPARLQQACVSPSGAVALTPGSRETRTLQGAGLEVLTSRTTESS